MKVIVDSNLTINNVFEPPMELHLQGKSLTLRYLLETVDHKCASIQLLSDGELGDDLRNIFLNGKDFFSLPQRLDTPLKVGDKVDLEIYMEPLGGG